MFATIKKVADAYWLAALELAAHDPQLPVSADRI